ncbi:MAG: hypothetical protein KKF46_04920 [Nanoarchaeota archaeon]|nr:hypothetical protein [Nanoarchaeota archaeon]MBU1321675.1 hypothetical protein [Nanoarchaeota archaeon]MBU1598413.1 hypothetical protein [Nanoarchaeota archaeon]MBU2441039.1 hypothetical protein [Nanoarchaeota archaeon]
MEPKSLFLKREGFTSKNKILNFLIIAQDFDYSLKDLANFSGISYPCMKQLKKDLIKNNWIVHTRNVGKAQMYKLNINSKKVQKFIEFYWSVIESAQDDKPSSSYTHSGTQGVSISARNI